MKKTITRLSVLILTFSMLTACTRSQFMDLSGFIYRFNRISHEDVELEDVYFYSDEGREVYEFFIEDDNPTVVVKLISDSGRISQVRVALSKISPQGVSEAVSAETVNEFTKTLECAVVAYCGFDKDRVRVLLNDFGIYNAETYKKQGELTVRADNFHLVYYSDALICEMILYNTYLETTENTEKPESKPAFGNTTNVRGETEPLPSFKR